MLIMIVDDEETVLNLLRDVLQARGYDVVSAHNGREALDRLKFLTVNLVVSDIYMPVVDGIKLHEEIRADARLKKLPFLFISGFNDKYTAGAVRDPRNEGFWRKGDSVEMFMRWVDYLVQPEDRKSKLRPDGVEVPPFVEPREENKTL
jgi:CheY-like chemotaxis protein